MIEKQTEKEEKYYTVKDLKKILNMGDTTIYRLINTPDFPKIKMGKRWLIPKSKFEAFMNRWANKHYSF